MTAPGKAQAGKLAWLAVLVAMTVGVGVYVVGSEFAALRHAGAGAAVAGPGGADSGGAGKAGSGRGVQ